MRAILICPYTETVEAIDLDVSEGNNPAIYAALSYSGEHGAHPVSCYDIVRLPNQQDVYVDDVGLCMEDARTFTLVGFGIMQPLAGRGLVLAHDGPNTIGTTIGVEEIRSAVVFGLDAPEPRMEVITSQTYDELLRSIPLHYAAGPFNALSAGAHEFFNANPGQYSANRFAHGESVVDAFLVTVSLLQLTGTIAAAHVNATDIGAIARVLQSRQKTDSELAHGMTVKKALELLLAGFPAEETTDEVQA